MTQEEILEEIIRKEQHSCLYRYVVMNKKNLDTLLEGSVLCEIVKHTCDWAIPTVYGMPIYTGNLPDYLIILGE